MPDSYTITIKQNVWLQGGMWLDKLSPRSKSNGRLSAIPVSIKQNVRFKGGICSEKLNQIQNGRLETFIINFDMSDIEKTVPDR